MRENTPKKRGEGDTTCKLFWVISRMEKFASGIPPLPLFDFDPVSPHSATTRFGVVFAPCLQGGTRSADLEDAERVYGDIR